MKIEAAGPEFRVVLSAEELRLLQLSLERASFVDTPVSEQERILSFCGRALDAIAQTRNAK